MFFVDANIFLEVEFGEIRSEECKEFFSKIIKREVDALTSDYIVYTCMLRIEYKSNSIKRMQDFLTFLDNSNIEIRVPSYETIDKALDFMEKYKLDFDDALVVSTMLFSGIKKLVSFDKDFDKVREIERIEPKNAFN